MRTPLVAGNWKMYTTPSTAAELAARIKLDTVNVDFADIAVFPPYICIAAVAEALKGSNIEIGAQDIFWEPEGAYTGAISARMIAESGCARVLVGHSERRTYFGETDEKVLKKTVAALSEGLKPIVCIGETLEQREAGITETILDTQLKDGIGALKNIDALTIAYEPVWAIGTGKTATPDQADEAHKYIRGLIAGRWGDNVSRNIRILYGGSVKPDNARSLWEREDIDGFLVGGASLKADSFRDIVNSVK
ncbi:MAG: triose-phosphate isomerase [Candidatus Zixiibacteriota bacterium]|nr:MAG: triose-phosphate isomerase [candidate division Zixibacteria bacterium]